MYMLISSFTWRYLLQVVYMVFGMCLFFVFTFASVLFFAPSSTQCSPSLFHILVGLIVFVLFSASVALATAVCSCLLLPSAAYCT